MSRVQYQGGTAEGETGKFWFRDRCNRVIRLNFKLGEKLRGDVYEAIITPSYCRGGTTFTIRTGETENPGSAFVLEGPERDTFKTWALSYQSATNEFNGPPPYELVFSVWVADDPISGIVQFSPDTFNEFGGIGMTARIACRNQVITNTINAVAPTR